MSRSRFKSFRWLSVAVVVLSFGAAAQSAAAAEWKLQTTPQPNTNTWIEDVSCGSATSCVSVGENFSTGGGVSQAWTGTAWTTLTSPAKYMTDVSCAPGTSACSALPSSGSNAYRLSGTGWTTEAMAVPIGATGIGMMDISCQSATFCMAVGHYNAPNESSWNTLAERWDGSKWTILPTPSEGLGNFLSTVSCTSAGACVAVGKNGGKPTALLWNGVTWGAIAPPNTAPGTLTELSCYTSTVCMKADWGELERLNGNVWSSSTVAKPVGSTETSIGDVACTSGTFCMAVGRYVTEGTSKTLAEVWNGTNWTVQSTPNPKEKTGVEFVSVSCTSATQCTAVGRYMDPKGQILAARYE